MASFLEVSDLTVFATIDEAKAQILIDDATAMAVLAAPCLDTAELALMQVNSVRAILRRAVLRWNESGTGAVVQQSAGPFSSTTDTRQPQRQDVFWPAEIAALRNICGKTSGGAFVVDTAPSRAEHGFFDVPGFDY